MLEDTNIINIESKFMSKEPKFKKIENWNIKVEKTIKIIEKQCRLYKQLHHEIAQQNQKRYNYFMISAIIITPTSAIISSLGTLISNDMFEILCIFTLTSSMLSFISTILLGIVKFNKYEEYSQLHKSSYSKYFALEENIKRQLILYANDRIDANEYLNWLTKTFDELFDNSPDFDTNILKKYSNDINKIESEFSDL